MGGGPDSYWFSLLNYEEFGIPEYCKMEIAQCSLCIRHHSSCGEVRYLWERRLNSAHNFDLLIWEDVEPTGLNLSYPNMRKHCSLQSRLWKLFWCCLEDFFHFHWSEGLLISIELKCNSWKIIKESISTGWFWLIFCSLYGSKGHRNFTKRRWPKKALPTL